MKHLLAALFLVLVSCAMYGQPVNYDESKVPEYSLPDVMKCKDGPRLGGHASAAEDFGEFAEDDDLLD